MTTPMYSNKSSSIVGQGIFQLRQMHQYLEWELDVDLATLNEFEEMIRKDFPGIGPCPTYIHPPVDKEVAAVAALCNPLLPHLQYQSLTLQQTTLYVSAQGSLCSLTPSLCIATRDPSPSYSPSLPVSSASSSTPLIPRTSQPRLFWLHHR